MDHRAWILFVTSATVLLGSPGPAIAALLAVGKQVGWPGGFRYYLGLQVGLATAAAISAAGLISVLDTSPAISRALSIIATFYLLYVAYAIASAPVGRVAEERPKSFSPVGGAILGLTNPKAYLAFASLFAAPVHMTHAPPLVVESKWMCCVLVMIVVDLAWLWFGIAIGQATWTNSTERRLNILMGIAVAASAVLALL